MTTVTTSIVVPPGLGGTTAWWQSLEAGVLQRLSNPVATTF
jgi:hypothetical protein